MDRRDEVLAKLALALRLVDAGGLNRALKLAMLHPGRSLDRVLEEGGLIDAAARLRLVTEFNQRLRQPGAPRLEPLPVPGAARASRAGRDLSDSDLLPLPADDDEALAVPGDDEEVMGASTDVLRVPDDGFDPTASDDTTDPYEEPTLRLRDEPDDEARLLAQPTMVLRDEDPPPVVLTESSEEEAIFAEPTIVLKEDAAAGDDEEAIFAEPTLVLAEPPPEDEDAILSQSTLVLKDASGDDIYAEPTLVLKDEPKKSDTGPIELDLRLGRDVSPTEQQKSNRLMPGVKSKKGGGPLTRDEFQRRLKMRQGFDGFSIGDYKVVTEIARGAFGVVLEVEPGGVIKSLARERGYEGNLALKVMLENKADPRETQRFLDEVKVLIRFDHPHIVRMFDAGVEQGLTYYSMELIKGTETRTHVLKHGPMPPLLAVRVGKEIASALAYVHSQRTYHRDLKPQNVMLDQRTQPYKALLIDFGLVTEHLSGADKGLILGTPSYMPPEQAQPRGGHGEVNVTSDIYSLGASLYFLLTGQPPFGGKDPRQIIKQVVSEKPRDPCELNPNIPKGVAAIVLKCLEKKQRDRYHGAKQLEADLESTLKSGQMMLKAKSFLGKFLGKPKK
ncbi:MAG: protein kinase [Planctomycetes bacterium]|nr:protein kinase [Planctomycetota bacterium]